MATVMPGSDVMPIRTSETPNTTSTIAIGQEHPPQPSPQTLHGSLLW